MRGSRRRTLGGVGRRESGPLLEMLGLGRAEERLYRALLRVAEASESALVNAAGVPPDQVGDRLARLIELRLAERRPGEPAMYAASPPDVAITALLNERQTDLDRARLAVPELMADYQRGVSVSGPDRLVEVCTGPGIGLRRFRELLATATDELLLFDRVNDPELVGASEVDAAAPMLRRGVRCRSIYEVSSLSLPGRLPHVRRLAAMGEQSRVSRQLPMKLAICDRRVAMLPLATGAGQRTESVVLIEPCELLDALVGLFEAYWQRSTPMATSARSLSVAAAAVDPTPPAAAAEERDDALTTADLELLRLLNLGLKDATIARQLGVSMRTTRRRITAILERLGVTTRFQAGIAAAKRGLL